MTERIHQLKTNFEKLEAVSEIFNGLHPLQLYMK